MKKGLSKSAIVWIVIILVVIVVAFFLIKTITGNAFNSPATLRGCTEDDGGNMGNVPGTNVLKFKEPGSTVFFYQNISDSCVNATSVKEYSCGNNSVGKIGYYDDKINCASGYECKNDVKGRGYCGTNAPQTVLYDDFSSGSLNTNKWIESQWHSRPFTNEHLVNSSEGAYHIRQNIVGDAETNLQPKRIFNSGDSFSYEIKYYNGSGNHASQPLINGNYPPSQLEVCNYQTAGCGVIGYWNALPDLGKIEGIYKINFNFSSNQVKMTTIRPDNVIVTNTFTGNSAPYNLTINTHTGHDGLMHFDIDNVYLSS